MSLIALLTDAEKTLAAAGVESPRLDAEVLLATLLNTSRADLYLRKDEALSPEATAQFEGRVRRRAEGCPVAYITGVKEFWSIPIQVTPAVLIPRPETELVVEVALALLKERAPARATPRILDLCTGSGCIAVALARELPQATFVVSDASPKAIGVAHDNLAFAFGRIEFRIGDLFEALADSSSGDGSLPQPGADDTKRFDLITANPPYIPRDEIPALAPEIARYEPHAALDGGKSGLDFARRIIEDAPAFLADGGRIVMEMGIGQGPALEAIGKKAGFDGCRLFADLAGIERVIALWKS